MNAVKSVSNSADCVNSEVFDDVIIGAVVVMTGSVVSALI